MLCPQIIISEYNQTYHTSPSCYYVSDLLCVKCKIYFFRMPVTEVRSGQTASFALKKIKRSQVCFYSFFVCFWTQVGFYSFFCLFLNTGLFLFIFLTTGLRFVLHIFCLFFWTQVCFNSFFTTVSNNFRNGLGQAWANIHIDF